jgi:DNA-directed RNA polymerase specialized sigma24 family protein
VRAAAKVGRHVHAIDNLRAYVDRAIGRAIKKTVVAQTKKDRKLFSAGFSNLADSTNIDHIENKILVRELLDTLAPQDREIMLRRIEGCTFPEIDEELNLRPRTAEARYRACKDALRQILSDKLDGRT